ncbi:hypothetical protein BJX64DRAFT_286951 [Aspergillus heterothallicus]
MNSDFQQPIVQDSGFQAAVLQNAGHYIDYTQHFDPSDSFYVTPSPNINGQGYSLPQFEENPHASSTGDMASVGGYSTAPFATRQSLGIATNASDIASLSSFANLEGFDAFPAEWPSPAQLTSQQNLDATAFIAQLPHNLQSIPFPYIAAYRPPFHAQVSAAPQGNRSDSAQRSTQIPAAPVAQQRMRTEPFNSAQLANISPGPTTSASSLSGSSSRSSQQRRHQRPTSLASPSQYHISRHHRSRSSNIHSRSRARPQSTTPGGTVPLTSSMREPSFQEPEHQPSTSSQMTQPTATTVPSRHPNRPEERARRNAYSRNMHPSDVQAMYEETLRHASFISAPWSQKKGLDIPQQDRPEPKETEELTLNMECRVCMAQLIDTVLLPCGHAILCRWCADQQFPSYKGHLKNKTPCPLCRETVRQRVRSLS